MTWWRPDGPTVRIMYEMQNVHVETVVGAEFESTYNM